MIERGPKMVFVRTVCPGGQPDSPEDPAILTRLLQLAVSTLLPSLYLLFLAAYSAVYANF